MANINKDDPLKLPKVKEITKVEAVNSVLKGGEAVNSADPDSPSFMVRDQSNPESLPNQEVPPTTNNN